MLKLLIKKQLFEQFRSCFINNKTLKRRSKSSTIAVFALYIGVLLMLSVSFFAMAFSMDALLEDKYTWLYYAFLGSLAILFGVIASAINAHVSLYKPKDNDLLLSLPIKTKDILISRLFVLYCLGFMYSMCVWLPTILVPIVTGKATLINIVISILVLFINPIFISALSSIFGYVIALVSNIFKNKSAIVSIISLVFLGIYLYFSTKINDIFSSVVENKVKIASFFESWTYPLYAMGKGCAGDLLYFVIYTLIAFALFAIVTYFLSINYLKLIIKSNETSVTKKDIAFSKQSSIKSTLLKKEFKHFISCSTYTVNCGFGILFVIGFAVYVIIKAPELRSIIDALNKAGLNAMNGIVPIGIVCIVAALTGTCYVSTPSISLEGKNIWIYQSLPITFKEIYEAKESLHILLVAVPSVIAIFIISICLRVDYSLIVQIATLMLMIVYLEAELGLVIGIINPNLHWTSEVTVIKQGVNCLISLLIGIAIPVIIGVVYYLTMNSITISNYLYCVYIAIILLILFAKKWLNKKGTILFNKLN